MDAVPEAGRTFSHYRLIEKIGEGGMGVVWKAEDTLLGRTVAVKLLPADACRDERRRKMFLDEARLASSVSEAHIVQLFDFGREGDLDFIVMEYVEGKPLSKLLKGRTLTPGRIAEIGQQVALALSRAHRKGLLHRDLKPSNILITTDGDAKVVDFGLAALFTPQETTFARGSRMTEAETRTTSSHPEERGIAGTLPYMSPEQVQGEDLDARSDIFSLGVVLYEMTTGQRPFTGPTFADVAKQIQEAKPKPVHELLPAVPLDLERHIQKAMAPHRGDRYQTMDDLAVDLKRLSRNLESGSSPSFASTLAGTRKRTVRWWGAAGAALLAALAIGASVYLWPRFSGQAGKASQASSTLNPNRVVVAIFENRTGDVSLDPLGKMASDWITEGLTRIGSVEVVPTSLVFGLARASESASSDQDAISSGTSPAPTKDANPSGVSPKDGAPSGAPSAPTADTNLSSAPPRPTKDADLSDAPSAPPRDPNITLAEATGAGLVVSGAYYLQGETLQIQTRITDVTANKVLYALEPLTGPREKVMEGVEAVRRSVVEAIAARQSITADLLGQEFRPPKYEAYEEYLRAQEVANVTDLEQVTEHLERALEIDPDFVAPRLGLIDLYVLIGLTRVDPSYFPEAAKQIEFLEKNAGRLTPVQRRMLDFRKAVHANQAEAALSVARELVRLNPGDLDNNFQLAAEEHHANHPRAAIAVLSRPIHWELLVSPSNMNGLSYFALLLESLHQIGEHEREIAETKRFQESYPELVYPLVFKAHALIALGRIDELEKLVWESLSMGISWGPKSGALMLCSARELRAHGHRDASLKMAGRAYKWYREHGSGGAMNKYRNGESLYIAERWEKARTEFESLVKDAPEWPEFLGFLGALAARRGDRAEAMRISEELRRIPPGLAAHLERPRRTYQRARIAALLGQKEEAVNLLRTAGSQRYIGRLEAIGPVAYATAAHVEIDFESLHGYPPYEELIKPKD